MIETLGQKAVLWLFGGVVMAITFRLFLMVERRNQQVSHAAGDKVILAFPPWYPRFALVLVIISVLLLLLMASGVVQGWVLPLALAAFILIPAFFILWSYYMHRGYFTQNEGLYYKSGLKAATFYPWEALERVDLVGKEYRLCFQDGRKVKIHRLMLGVNALIKRAAQQGPVRQSPA